MQTAITVGSGKDFVFELTEQVAETLRNKRQTGVIKSLNASRGYGFIGRNKNAADLFFHASACQYREFEMLTPGDRVTFEVGDGTRGPGDSRPLAVAVRTALTASDPGGLVGA